MTRDSARLCFTSATGSTQTLHYYIHDILDHLYEVDVTSPKRCGRTDCKGVLLFNFHPLTFTIYV
ncbi:hypothetical protein BGX38DRAFT_1232239, partial [Terfezia claveryi]